MAAGAALAEMMIGRVAWYGLGGLISDHALRQLHGWPATLARNLAAVSGLVAVTFSLLAYLRLPGFAPIGRRLAVAAFSGIFVPSIVVATVLPYAALRQRLVLFGLAAANVLVTLLGMTAVRYRPGRALRLAVAGATLSSLFTLSVVGFGQLVNAPAEGPWAPVAGAVLRHPTVAQHVLLTLRHLGELCWIVSVFGAAGAAMASGDAPDDRHRRWIGVGLGAVIAAAILVGQHAVDHRYRLVLFGSFRLGLLVDQLWRGVDLPHASRALAIYAFPLGAGLGTGLVALTRRNASARQLGAGLLVWLAAGFGPHTPIQLLYMVLGATLITRASQALDPQGSWRTQQPWRQLVAPTSPSSREPLSPEADR